MKLTRRYYSDWPPKNRLNREGDSESSSVPRSTGVFLVRLRSLPVTGWEFLDALAQQSVFLR